MDKQNYMINKSYFLFGLRIFDTVERGAQIQQENAQHYEVTVKPEYYNMEFDVSKDDRKE